MPSSTFMLSNDFQSVIPTTNWMYPAVMPGGGLPEGFDTGGVPASNRCCLPPAEVAALREAAVAEWLARAQPLGAPDRPGRGVGSGAGCLGPVARGDVCAGRGCAWRWAPRLWAALRFTLWQAALSAVLQRRCWRSRWRGRWRGADFPGRRAVDHAAGCAVHPAGDRRGVRPDRRLRAQWHSERASGRRAGPARDRAFTVPTAG